MGLLISRMRQRSLRPNIKNLCILSPLIIMEIDWQPVAQIRPSKCGTEQQMGKTGHSRRNSQLTQDPFGRSSGQTLSSEMSLALVPLTGQS